MGGPGSGGSNKKSLNQHFLAGTYRPDRHGLAAGLPSVGRARLPFWVTGHARAFWRRHAPELVRLGLLDALTQNAFLLLCCSWGHLRDAEDILAVEGMVITVQGGADRPHPAVRAATEAGAVFVKLAHEWGLTPLGRRRLGLPDRTERDSKADFFEVWEGKHGK